MPGHGQKDGVSHKPKMRRFKAKHQRKRFIRAKDPVLAVFMWGVQHSVNEVTTTPETSLLLPEDFKAYSKLRVENQYYNKENLPGHFKFKEYCPRVFHDLRKRFFMDDIEYMSSMIEQPPRYIENPGRSGAKLFLSFDRRVVAKSITSEEVALLHLILQPYHAHIVTCEGRTLLPHYFGMYRLTVNNAETYWIAMRNVLSCVVNINQKFDLKGSTVDRAASHKEKAKENPTLKDNDFLGTGEKIIVGEENRDVFLSTLSNDTQFLQKLNLMDYSLLVGIHDPSNPEETGIDYDFGMEKEYNSAYLSSDDPELPHSPLSAAGDFHSSGGMLESPSSPEQFSDPPDFSPDVEIVPETNVKPKDLECNSGQSGSSENAEVGAIGITCSSDVDVESTPHTFHPAVVEGVDAVQAALKEGMFPVLDKTVDVFAVPSAPGSKPQVYFMGIIDVLTIYGARKRAAHAAKTVKHGAGAEISTVKPEQYARRFLEFVSKIIV